MIPILYESTETAFSGSGLGFLADAIECKVTEERNGIYELELKYPITGAKYGLIKERSIIMATHDDSGDPQPFDVYGYTAPLDGIVTYYAHHISYRLSDAVVTPLTANWVDEVIDILPDYLIGGEGFTFWTDKTTSGAYEIKYPKPCRAVLGGTENSLLDVYGGGDYEFDKFDVKLWKNRGRDTDVEIRYGKNLVDLEHRLDVDSNYNVVVPFWYGEETGELVTLPGYWIGRADTSPYKVVSVYDLSEEFEEKPTVAQLRNRAVKYLNKTGAWEATEGFKVDFVAMWQTEEYKDFAPLQRVNLCDTVKIFCPQLGLNGQREKVVKTVYNVLLDRYDEITLNETPYRLK